MSNNSNLAIGAGVGAVAGASAGIYKGARATKDIMKNAKDAYVEYRQAVNLDNILNSYKSYARQDAALERVAKDAANNFLESDAGKAAAKLVKSIKAKWAIGLAAGGALIGGAVAFGVNKAQANKAEKLDQQA